MAASKPEEGVCPVDHSTRDIWLKQAASKNEYLDAKLEKHPSSASSSEEKCPVDHSSRDAWLKQAQASQTSGGSEEKCPVDLSSRDVWLKQASARTTANGGESFDAPHPNTVCPQDKECISSNLDSSDIRAQAARVASQTGLPTDREVSTIPRSGGPGGNWVYPSQAQFFAAMQRKNWDPQAADMASVVPIHNAVNERAWTEILKWEEPVLAGKPASFSQCGGPQLVSFTGDARKLSPKARLNATFLGWQKPFDRHDWVITRCGEQTVEYVIDFYTGKPNPAMPGLPSFYLDVRPKMNTIEGVRMRVMKWIGLI